MHIPIKAHAHFKIKVNKNGIMYKNGHDLLVLLYPPYPKDRGMLWFYVEAARRPSPAARNGVNAITQKPRDGLFSNLVYTLVVIVSWPD